MYNVVIDIVKSIENIIKSCNKEFNNKVFNMSIFYEVTIFSDRNNLKKKCFGTYSQRVVNLIFCKWQG